MLYRDPIFENDYGGRSPRRCERRLPLRIALAEIGIQANKVNSGVFMRGAAYIDGFNFYHAVDDLGQPQ